jgi:hypothetical protein
MYGLVNKAIQDLISTSYSKEAWLAVKRKAGVDVEGFISMEAYPDEMTYRLVGAASEVLHTAPEKLLEAFGEHWVRYTAQEGYGELLKVCGGTLPEFLMNLDNLHAHVGLSFPALRPPSFRCTDVQGGSLRLHYYSSRQGLAPMVAGLLKGLGVMFNTKLDVSTVASRHEGADHDEFLVQFDTNTNAEPQAATMPSAT